MSINNFFRRKDISTIISEAEKEHGGPNGLVRTLGLRDLTFLGIAAIIGAGIFGTIGQASANGGPGVSLLFVFTSVACLFSALCYAQFASVIPISGSAYTYSYTSFGELIAWIIGWDLVMEYAIGNVTVSISWSDYFVSFLSGFHIQIPAYLTMDYFSAKSSFLASQKVPLNSPDITSFSKEGIAAWKNAPEFAGIKMIFDAPALMVNILITYLVYIGIKETKHTNNLLVILKLAIILLVIISGLFYVNPGNWSPFAPNGLSGIMQGVSAVFFAYIGFDAISTTAEEAINPKKDLPKAMVYALIICTLLYVAITFILTGMVSYKNLAVGDPLAYAFEVTGLQFLSGVVAIGAVIAMTSVLLVFQLGQPRIWMSMSRDGLLPKAFSRIHPKYQTPSFATIITGIVVGLPLFFFNLQEVADLTSIGTLFAFALVCGGIMIKPMEVKDGGFKVPYYNSKFIVPALFIGIWAFVLLKYPESVKQLFNYQDWEVFRHKIAFIIFLLLSVILTILSFFKNLSLIPMLGLITNLYLMSQLGYVSWVRFLIWLVIGLAIYLFYGFNRSKLNKAN